MDGDRKIVISKSLLQSAEMRGLSHIGKVVLLSLAMEIDEYGIIYFPGWKAHEYGIGLNNFYNGMKDLKKRGFIEPVEGTQSRYRIIDTWQKGKK